MNLRIKELRKRLKLIQEDFAKKIGVQRPTVAWMEKPGNTITKQNIKIICDTFNVNEAWLRTGEGEMFKQKEPTDIMDRLKDELELDVKDMELIRAFVELPPEQRKKGIEFMEALSMNISDLLPSQTAANQDTTSAKFAHDGDTKKDAPCDASAQAADSPPVAVFKSPAQQVTGKLPANDPQDSTAQQAADAGRPDNITDKEWALILMARQEEEKGSQISSSTESARA